jgi:2-polyprenyl-3-methyl-5-hydroxy-6-metoxy-1,4-benzoquinol methylase
VAVDVTRRVGGARPALRFDCPTCGAAVSSPPRPTNALHCPGCGASYPVEDGIVLLGERPTDDDPNQPDEYYSLMVEIEPRHFWFEARSRLIRATLAEALGSLDGRSVLDVGCGTGYVLGDLDKAGMITCGIDMHLECLRYARERSDGAILCASAHHLPFDSQFDAALLCDVIEHVDDDVAVLRTAAQAVRPGGVVLVTVPAHRWLWSALDDVAVHKRRYERDALRAALLAAGLTRPTVRHFNALLTPLQLLQRLMLRRQSIATAEDRERVVRRAMRVPPAPLNALLRLAGWVDIPLSRVGLPFGPSLIGLATRA